jgi:SprT protein
MAYYRERSIGLSSLILDTPERLDSTLRHEYAHLLAYARHGRKGAGHGPAWQQAMVDLGEEPVVHHRYEVHRNQARQQVLYVCKRCGNLLPRKRRLPKRRRYVHAQCGGALSFHSVQTLEGD